MDQQIFDFSPTTIHEEEEVPMFNFYLYQYCVKSNADRISESLICNVEFDQHPTRQGKELFVFNAILRLRLN